MYQLLCQSERSARTSYSELRGKGHLFSGLLVTDGLKQFYKEVIDQSRTSSPTKSFSVVVSNPAEMGPKGGLQVGLLKLPGQLGRIEVSKQSLCWNLDTSNIARFRFVSRNSSEEPPETLLLDGQMFEIPSWTHLLSVCFTLKDGRWHVSSLTSPHAICKIAEFPKQGDTQNMPDVGREFFQFGPLSAIMRKGSVFVIRDLSQDCSKIALQVSRNLFQYFAADTEIVKGYGEPLGGKRSGLILAKGRSLPRLYLEHSPITISKVGIGIPWHDGHRRVIGIEDGAGAIFLSSNTWGELELVVWGVDDDGLRLASRMIPLLTGVGQPDFIIVGKRCTWQGTAGVLAIGSFTSRWEASEGSYIFQATQGQRTVVTLQ